MAKHLYLWKSEALPEGMDSPFVFGVNPTVKGSYQDYFSLDRKISLKSDLKWGEVEDLQSIFRGAEMWTDFPAEGLKFVSAELKAGDENQRVDLLYLRDDGGLYPCELKIGGSSLDSHGQLIRYMADLHHQSINAEWLVASRLSYLTNRGVTDSQERSIESHKLRRFLSDKAIDDRHIHLVRNAGIIVDEDFKSQNLTAVRYLNEQCGFSIRLLRLDAFAAQNWSLDQAEFHVRIDVVEVQ